MDIQGDDPVNTNANIFDKLQRKLQSFAAASDQTH